MTFSLPKIKYEYSELEPYIDKETMETHHSKHHQAYIDNLNNVVDRNNINETSLYEIIADVKNNEKYKDIKQSLINNGGGHYNHSFFWYCMTADSDEKDISENLLEDICKSFGSFDEMMDLFNKSAVEVFGSGWVWLCYAQKTSKLVIMKSFNQDNPIMDDRSLVPLLALDVWEHAYYLKYKNKRKEYISNWWSVVDWKFVSDVYNKIALKGKNVEISKEGYLNF